MRNPFGSEGEAFRFLLVAVVAAIVVAAASAIDMWLAVAAAVLDVAAIAVWLRRSRLERIPPPDVVESAPHNGARRVLLLAASDAAVASLRDRMESRLDGSGAEVLVVVPALTEPLEATTGAVDDRREDAQGEADALAAQLSAVGVLARGAVGADDPLLALEDALREFGADEVVLAAHESLLATARKHLAVPVSVLG